MSRLLPPVISLLLPHVFDPTASPPTRPSDTITSRERTNGTR